MRLPELGAAQLLGLGAEAFGHRAVAAEGLEDPDAEDGLLDHGGEVAVLVLGEAGGAGVAGLEAAGEHEQRDDGEQGDQRQPPVLGEHHHRPGQEHHRVDDQEDQREGQEQPHGVHVGGGPGEQLAGAPTVVEGDRQPLELGEEVAAHRRLQPGQRAGQHHPAGEEQPGLDQAHEQQQADQRPEGGQVVLGERAVHDPAEDHRDGEGAQHAERGGRHRDGQPAADGAGVRPQAQQGADRGVGAHGRGVVVLNVLGHRGEGRQRSRHFSSGFSPLSGGGARTGHE